MPRTKHSFPKVFVCARFLGQNLSLLSPICTDYQIYLLIDSVVNSAPAVFLGEPVHQSPDTFTEGDPAFEPRHIRTDLAVVQHSAPSLVPQQRSGQARYRFWR